ncbi:MAG: response regulator [Bacteroidota bacterium]|nr:response regulator [Bacteroidota bacterium]
MESTVPLNAMIVEDEKELCFLLSLVLIQKNLNPSCAYSIAEAKKNLEKIRPSVLFLDNRLPDGYGIDFISVIKHDFPSTKIVMMTAHNSPNDIQSALQRGADFFISKPFNSAIIKNTIDLLKLGETG